MMALYYSKDCLIENRVTTLNISKEEILTCMLCIVRDVTTLLIYVTGQIVEYFLI